MTAAGPAESEDEGLAFDWLEDTSDVIVRFQPAVAVYPGSACGRDL